MSRARRAASVALVALGALAAEPRLGLAQSPHGDPHGGNPHGQQRGPGTYTPPEDVIANDAAIPPGKVVARLVDAEQKPIAGAEVVLGILHQSVALGDTRDSVSATTNEDGFAEFADLKIGTGHVYHVKTTRDGASFQSGPFQLNKDSGAAVILHVFEASPNLENTMVFTPDARVFISFKEDVLVVQVEALLANPSPVAWVADYTMLLPEGFKAFSTEDEQIPSVIATETGARIKGTVRPGGVVVRFRFHVPHHNQRAVQLPIVMPPRATRVMVAAEASKKMSLAVDGFPKEGERVKDRGRSLLKAEKQWTPRDGDAFIPKVNVRLAGLPTRGFAPWLAAALAAVASLTGAGYLLRRRRDPGPLAKDAKDDLIEAREAMLAEIVNLERAYREGEIGPRAYGRIRQAMVDALARIVDKLEGPAVSGGGAFAPPEPDEPRRGEPGADAPRAGKPGAKGSSKKRRRPRSSTESRGAGAPGEEPGT